MLARPLLLLSLLVMGTGCRHTMGSAGGISMALHKDMTEGWRKCDMPKDEWLAICDNRPPRKTSVECPAECRPH